MKKMDAVYIPYRQDGEPSRKAGIAPVEFSLDGLSDDQVQMLGHLSDAADCMNSIFRDQFSPDTELIQATLEKMLAGAEEPLKTAIENYLAMLCLQNSPWALLPRKNHLLDAERSQLEALADKAGVRSDFDSIAAYLFEAVELSDRANFYPADMNEDDFEALDGDAKKVNTSIVKNGEGYRVIYNEERYLKLCAEAVDHLREARKLSDDIGFQIYLDAKIEEMTTGTEEARRLADYHWVRHNSPIDIIISSAIEVYLDAWKNAKGSAAANVTVKNVQAEELLKKLIEKVPALEANAPWKYRRYEINPETLPKLKFVDILNWTGDYVTGPMTTIAQSLPNDEWVGKNIGTVNMVYRNTGKAAHSISGSILTKEFLPKEIVAKYDDKLFEAGQLHSALHEIGHTTGKQDPEHPGQPRDYLEAEYSPLEEARAELFGMWATSEIQKDGIIDEDTAVASHYSMLLSMVSSLKFEPNQAHTQARNMMWHYFDEKGAIARVEEDGRVRFALKLDMLDEVIKEMLEKVANIKAAGDKAAAVALREKYCYVDELRPAIEKRTKDSPLGRGLIFPELEKDGDKYLGKLSYPEFRMQKKFRK